MEVQFNNEGFNMFVFLVIPCLYISIPIATHAIKGHATRFSECVVPSTTYTNI